MLKRINGTDPFLASIKISDAKYPAPFPSQLEYGCPARGTWNIVHTGFLIPQAHEIFVCAEGCLRGVVLTAAEMNASDRFSTVEVREQNLLDGDMEQLIIEGVTDILGSLDYKPRAVLVYTSCIHHFVGCDLGLVYRTLRERFADIDFTDCYMTPIMRKSGLTPDQLMRQQLYSLISLREKDPKKINIIGNNLPTDKACELFGLAQEAGYEIREITDCKTYDEYQSLGEASANICFNPVSKCSGEELEKRLGQKLLYLKTSFSYDEIEKQLSALCGYMGVRTPDFSKSRERCENALRQTREIIGDAPVVIDYTAVLRPLSLARLLLTHGFNVTAVYADGFTGEEREDFDFLKMHFPQLDLFPTVNVRMRSVCRTRESKTLAIGQKAAYFTGTRNFVNIVENGGMYGFEGIIKLCGLISDAWTSEKDTRRLIQIKGMGCGCV